MKKNGILWCTCLLIIVVGGLGIFIRLGYANPPETNFVFPETGTWSCEDLGITIMLDEGACVVVRGEDEISCSILRERGSDKLYIHCYEFNNPDYAFEYLFFSGDIKEVHEDRFTIQEHESGTEYTFLRQQ